jgi:hypothetical protein
MLEINLDGALPTHVERIKPNISVGETGEINWTPAYLDYNAANYYPGKTVRSEEFNKHILQQIYQGNYNTDVMKEVFTKHLPDMVYKAFSSEFKLRPSYVKIFTETDWGERQEDGYYYITIPPEVHGFVLENTEQSASSITVDTEMYMLNTDNKFYEVMQALVQPDNTVQIYTDDATTPGFVIVRLNDKSLSIAQVNIHANQINGLHKIAVSGKYSDLIGLSNSEGTGPEDKINANKESIEAIISGEDKYFNKVTVKNATDAENAVYATNLLASGNIQNIKVLDIFETGSNYVKDATHAKQADNVTNTIAGKALTDIFETDGVTAKKATDATNYTKTGTIASKFNEINTRLNDLGFKSGTVEINFNGTLEDPYPGSRTIYREGNTVYGQAKFFLSGVRIDNWPIVNTGKEETWIWYYLGYLDKSVLYPAEEYVTFIYVSHIKSNNWWNLEPSNYDVNVHATFQIKVQTNGEIYYRLMDREYTNKDAQKYYFCIPFTYKAKPIN